MWKKVSTIDNQLFKKYKWDTERKEKKKHKALLISIIFVNTWMHLHRIRMIVIENKIS